MLGKVNGVDNPDLTQNDNDYEECLSCQ
jgi:hypothetical protein